MIEGQLLLEEQTIKQCYNLGSYYHLIGEGWEVEGEPIPTLDGRVVRSKADALLVFADYNGDGLKDPLSLLLYG